MRKTEIAISPITAEHIRQIFKLHKVIRGNLKIPDDDGFSMLAKHATAAKKIVISSSYNMPDERKELIDRVEEIIELSTRLLKSEMEIKKIYEWAVENREIISIGAFGVNDRIDIIENFIISASNLRSNGLLSGYKKQLSMNKWHSWAVVIASSFCSVINKNNPTVSLRYSNTGPIVRYLRAIIPLITGEEPSTVAIARYLQRRIEVTS